LGYAIAGAIIFAFVGFIAGFLGPLLFFPPPKSQAPLNALWTTPLGALLGFIAGALFAQFRPPKA
jgi:uncharacterized membrane protein